MREVVDWADKRYPRWDDEFEAKCWISVRQRGMAPVNYDWVNIRKVKEVESYEQLESMFLWL